MTTKIICDKIIDAGRIFSGILYLRDGRIEEIQETGTACRDTDVTFDFSGSYMAPGFIDMHTHGGGGHAFLDTTPEEVIAACRFHLEHGTTTVLPTVSAAPFPAMAEAVRAIAAARHDSRLVGTVLGAHLEGPYLSVGQCGAQTPDFITPPVKRDYEALIEEMPGEIARWTYAPEHDKDGAFCRFLAEHGVLPSAGHSDAVYADMDTALASGCRLVTHLYSCTSTVTRDHGFRSLGIIETAFLRDDLYAEIIADGKHLPPELINMILKIKGTDRVALVTDSLSVAGTDAKEGVMSGTEYLIEDGVCKLRDRSAFAGSIATADGMMRVMTKQCGVPLAQAVKMMTNVPSDILNIRKGKLIAGYDADLIVFDDDIRIKNVFIGGKPYLPRA